MNLSFRRVLQVVGVTAVVLSTAMISSTAFGQNAAGSTCRDPLAKAAKALFCEMYSTGYVTWRDSMQAPNTNWHSRGEMEVIVFDQYVVVSQHGGSMHMVVPRDRIVYLGSEEIQ